MHLPYTDYSNSTLDILQAMSEFEKLMEKLDSKLEEFKEGQNKVAAAAVRRAQQDPLQKEVT